MPLVMSVTVTPENTTVIGGAHPGLNDAVTLSSKLALPFCTGNVPASDIDSLLAALGCFSPLLMHSAVAETTMLTSSSSPSPASLPWISSVLPVRVALTVLAHEVRAAGQCHGGADESAPHNDRRDRDQSPQCTSSLNRGSPSRRETQRLP